jgi:oxygen-independent coproporphyrinogen-3 oxidase
MTPPLSLYVHWPWCKNKCPYCDFNSHVTPEPPAERYIAALTRELTHLARLVGKRSLTSIFFGGGTPSLMAPAHVKAVITAAGSVFEITDSTEITLEANPTSAEAKNFIGYRAAGVNRLSIGVQSLTKEDLTFLGREHSADEALRTVEMALETVGNVNLDLIFGLPEQSVDGWARQLRRAVGMGTPHLSCYQLTIEPNTAFFSQAKRGVFTMPDSDKQADFEDATQEELAAARFINYEISNHARDGYACTHNIAVWRYGDYGGVGAGAHGRITLQDGTRVATRGYKMPDTYMDAVMRDGHGWYEQSSLSLHRQTEEALLMGLRLREGVALARLPLPLADVVNTDGLRHMVQLGFVSLTPERLTLTPAGWPLLDGVLRHILPEATP